MPGASKPVPAPTAPLFPAGRLAISALFFANGFTIGSWAPKIPEFAETLGIGEAALGLMILIFGLGSLIMMPLGGAMIARTGSSVVVKATAIGSVPTLLLLTIAPNIVMAAIAIALFGGLIGAMDVAMNANAVHVEKRMRRAIMSSCHGFWSLGGLFGAALGGWLIGQVGILAHVLIVTLVLAIIVAAALSNLSHDPLPVDEERPPLRLPANPLPYLIGMMALFAMMPEGAILDWSALYLRQELASNLTQSGLAFGAFSATMALMRFAGDPIRDRLGAVTTLRVCLIIAFTGMMIAGQAPNATVAIIGFAIAGIGISNLVPIAFSAAGNLPGMAQGIGLSVVTFMGYSGILVAPSVIGFIAAHTGFAAVFTFLPLLFIVVLATSGLARHANMEKDQ